MDKSWILLDESTGLHVGWYFWLRVLDEVNRAARYGAPFALLLLEIGTLPACPARAVDEAASRVPDAIRSTGSESKIVRYWEYSTSYALRCSSPRRTVTRPGRRPPDFASIGGISIGMSLDN